LVAAPSVRANTNAFHGDGLVQDFHLFPLVA